ncbi:GNAT family N-acetyltransferase [Variovorax sp. AFSI2.2]|uniref:GNAT family N-acetyltransferase n=1 Tax=Variovorax sp. AFSI2.2 TaxID=3384160 RepID=UPI003EB8613B
MTGHHLLPSKEFVAHADRGSADATTQFAVPFHESFGFHATGPRVETKGIAFIPMKLAQV